MSAFSIDLGPIPGAEGDLRSLSIRANQSVLTRLVRQDANHEDQALQVPVIPLAFWFADHWWRLRWECRPLNGFPSAWRQAHELTAVGAGYAWPRVMVWGEGERTVIVSRSDPVGVVGPVRLLQNSIGFVPAVDYETAVSSFLEQAVAIATGKDGTALSSLVDALGEERAAEASATWRRLEAINGFDPDQAPESLIEGQLRLAERFTLPDIEEVVASLPGETAEGTLESLVDVGLRHTGFPISFGKATEAGRLTARAVYDEPWRMAEAAAGAVRRTLGAGKRPLRNKALGELVGIDPKALQTSRPDRSLPYGLRIVTENGEERVLLQARWGHDRRFEVMRALGDAIWTSGSRLGPISRSGTARQKFQRAFAASMLCPADALREYLQTDEPTEDDISEGARHFHVAEQAVRTVLVNKRLMERGRIFSDEAIEEGRLRELSDAA